MENLKVVYWAENQVEADLICGMIKECNPSGNPWGSNSVYSVRSRLRFRNPE